jgi:ABC-type enterobactin transport system permease subunit
MARKIRRYPAEPAFIAGCGLAGALYAAQHGNPHGDDPVIGMAAGAASLATSAGLARLLVKAYRARANMVGTFGDVALRFAVLLLCFAFEVYGLSCTCDDVSQATYTREMVRFE